MLKRYPVSVAPLEKRVTASRVVCSVCGKWFRAIVSAISAIRATSFNVRGPSISCAVKSVQNGAKKRKKMKILLIDHSYRIREQVTKELVQVGHRTIWAPHHMSAIPTYRKIRPNITFINLDLATAYGLDVAFDIHTLYPSAKIAIITSEFTPAIAYEAISAGCVGLIDKNGGANPSISKAVWDIASTGSHFTAEQIQGAALISTGIMEMQFALCNRDFQIIYHLSESRSVREIAQLLNSTMKHINRSISSIHTKAGRNLDSNILSLIRKTI